ncbi:MAG: DUF3833 domain-containing protein [Acidobacteriota bacterium]|nr:DUF3833 domain-containing protein [Acidobacteriota bacterium]
MAPAQFAANRPSFEPLTFFEGPTHSWAVIENRRGDPTSQFRADLVGRREGDEIAIEQNFTFAGGRREQRLWRIRRIDGHHYEATANDVVGVSRGEAWGNVFRWSYTTAGSRRGWIDDLHYDLWMYLMEDGETLINRVTITKLGIVVARTTEYFRRGALAQ